MDDRNDAREHDAICITSALADHEKKLIFFLQSTIDVYVSAVCRLTVLESVLVRSVLELFLFCHLPHLHRITCFVTPHEFTTS